MKQRVVLLCVLLLVLHSCNNSDHIGYTRLSNSIHYKLDVIGEEDQALSKLSDGYVNYTIQILDGKEEINSEKKGRQIPVERFDQYSDGLKRIFHSMHVGDKTFFKAKSAELEIKQLFPTLDLKPDSILTFSISIDHYLSEEDMRSIRADERLKRDLELKEMAELNEVLDSLDLDENDEFSGIYYKEIKPGSGLRPTSGAMIWVNYVGRFADGKVFDNTYAGKTALEYEIGKPDQVIPGFATGISNMRQGGKAVFVIPSSLAFGSRGSSSGIVPPFKTVIYEVELLRVGV